MKTTEWKLEDCIKTKRELIELFIAAAEDTKPRRWGEFKWVIGVCEEILKIAEHKGWKK